MFVDMNPYMYTLEKLDHPDALTKEQANNIVLNNQWDFAVSDVIDEEQTAGVERHLYYLTADNGAQVGTAGIIYNKSGKSTSFSYNISNTDVYQSDAGIEFAVRTVCDFYGGQCHGRCFRRCQCYQKLSEGIINAQFHSGDFNEKKEKIRIRYRNFNGSADAPVSGFQRCTCECIRR